MKNVPCILLSAVLLLAAALPARAQWMEADTEHFRFVFEERDRASVDELLTFCEEVYREVTGLFGSYPERIPVVVLGRVDSANGYQAGFPMRLGLYTIAGTWPWQSSRTSNWLRMLLTHELTHYVHVTMDRGFFHALSGVFGTDADEATFSFLPGWMIEGASTNTETIFTTGGRGRDPFFEVQYEAPAMERRMFSLGQAGYDSAFPPSGRIYVGGYILVHYLLERYGRDVFAAIMTDYLCFPFFGISGPIRRVTGEDIGTIYRELEAELASRARSREAIAGGALASPDRLGDWYHPVVTARGLYLFRSDIDHGAAIVRYEPVSAAEQTLVDGYLTDESSFGATADGRLVCYATLDTDYRRADGESSPSDLWMLDVERGRPRRLTVGAHLWHPAFSADGGRLVAVQGFGSYSRLVEVDRSSGAMRVLFSRAEATVYNPEISPDGRRVAFALNVRGFQDVCVMEMGPAAEAAPLLEDPRSPVVDVNREMARPVLGPDPSGEYFPRWNGSERLLFSSDRSGSLALYEAELATGAVTLVQEDPVAAWEGVVRDGTLLYSSYSSRGWCLKSAARPPSGSGPAVANDAVAPYPEPTAWTGASVAARRYLDIPYPYLWLPNVTFGSGSPGAYDVGLGASVLAGSLVGTSAWSIDAAWHPATAQPEIALAGSIGLGPVYFDAAWAAGYFARSGAYFWQQAAVISSTVSLWSRSLGNRAGSAAVNAGAALISQLGSYGSFTFGDLLRAPSDAWLNAVEVMAGAGVAWGHGGGPLDFYLTGEAVLSAGATYLLPAFGLQPGIRLTGLAEGLVPAFGHTRLRAGLKGAWGIDGLFSTSESFAAPRGSFLLPSHSLPGRVLASLDYLVPISLLDLPFVYGTGIVGISAGAHAELTAEWSVAPAAFVPGSLVYLGVELTLQFGVGIYSYPYTLGVAAAFDAADGWRYDTSQGIGIYLATSFDTFPQGARPAARSVGPAAGGDVSSAWVAPVGPLRARQ